MVIYTTTITSTKPYPTKPYPTGHVLYYAFFKNKTKAMDLRQNVLKELRKSIIQYCETGNVQLNRG